MRFVRFAIGLGALIYAVADKQLLIGIAGVLLILMGIFNAGCCCSGSCTIPGKSRSR